MKLLVIALVALLGAGRSCSATRSRHKLRELDTADKPWSSWAQNKFYLHANEGQSRERVKMKGHQKVKEVKTSKTENEASTACREVLRSGPACDGDFSRFHEEYSMEGDITLAGLFPVHLGVGCNMLEDMGSIQRLEAMAYAVKEVNKWPNFLQNFTLGFRLFDTCNSASAAMAHTFNVLPHCANCSHYPICFPECPLLVTGIVGPESSSNTLLAAHACNLALTPIISYFATSVELTDRTVFPTLFATVPADDQQVSAMLDLLEYFGWTYFSVVHTDDRYGKDALDYIQLNMDEMCLASVAQVSSEGTSASYDAVVADLMQYKERSDASVVIVFTDGRSANKLFQAVERANVIGEFIWIGSEGWGVSMNDISTMLHVAQGAVTFTPHTEFDPKFDEYFQSLPINHTDNPWWEEVWQNHFNCSFDVPDTDERSCYKYEHIDVSNGYVPDSTVSLVNDAVYAFAYAINDYVNKNDLHYDADGKPVIPPWELINYIRDNSFPGTSTGSSIRLGDVTALYDIKNLQVNDAGGYDYVSVGYWSNKEGLKLNESKIQWPGRKETTPRSYCSAECHAGEIQILLKISCCWDCEPCPRGSITNETRCEYCPSFYWPNDNFTVCEELEMAYLKWNEPVAIVLLTLATTVLWVALLTSFYMIRHRNDRLVKASGRELMMIIMLGVYIQIGLTFIILAKPTRATCFCIRFLFGLDVTITYSAILVKSNRIYRIFRNGRKSAQPPIWIKKYQQILTVFFIVFMQVIILAVLCLMYPPIVAAYQPAPDVAELSCEIEEITVLVPLAFNLLIFIPCLYYGWKTRSLPANFNESRYIAFTVCTTLVIWVAFIPIYLTVGTNQTTSSEVHVEILTTVELMSAFITLACFFFPKLYALKFVPTASWHVSSMYRKRPNSSLAQCGHCGSFYSRERNSEMNMSQMNNRNSGFVIHRSAQPTELNRFGRRRASSFAEACMKIKAAQEKDKPQTLQISAASNMRRSSSAPDLTLLAKDLAERPKFVRSKTDISGIQLCEENDETDDNSSSTQESIPEVEAKSKDASSFYLFVPTPNPSRRSSSTSMRRSSVVTPVNFTLSVRRPVAFSSTPAKPRIAVTTPTDVKNGHVGAYVPRRLSPPEIQHPNQIPATPKMNEDDHERHVTIIVPETHSEASGSDDSGAVRFRSSSDAAEKRRMLNAQNQRRRSSLVQIANVLPVNDHVEANEIPRPRVLAYSKYHT